MRDSNTEWKDRVSSVRVPVQASPRQGQTCGNERGLSSASRDAADGTDEENDKGGTRCSVFSCLREWQKHDDTAMLKYEQVIRKLQEDPRLAAATSRVPSTWRRRRGEERAASRSYLRHGAFVPKHS